MTALPFVAVDWIKVWLKRFALQPGDGTARNRPANEYGEGDQEPF